MGILPVLVIFARGLLTDETRFVPIFLVTRRKISYKPGISADTGTLKVSEVLL